MYIQKGEVREVAIEVHSRVGNPFTIDTADYEVVDYEGAFVEKGNATIDAKKIITMFHGTDVGMFYLIFTYKIGSETLKAKIKIEVIG